MRIRKWLKALLLLVAIVLLGLIVTVVVLWRMVRSQPDFYRIAALPPEQIEAAAQSATNKIATIQNRAARLRAGQRAAKSAGVTGATANAAHGSPAASESEPITVTFTDTELNAFFEKWSNFQNWKDSYQHHVQDPIIILRDGRVILAGKLTDSGLIASLHFEPSITADGKLDLRLARVLGGNLPLPQSLIGGYERRIIDALDRRLPAWQRSAAFDDGGAANSPLICASLAKLCTRVLNHEPAEPVLFLPIFAQKGSVPVRLTQVKIVEGSMTLTVEPMSRDQQKELMEQVRE